MKTLVILFIAVTSYKIHAAPFLDFFQYPEDRTYTSADRGLMPYRALSLYQTNTFTLTFDDGPDPVLTPMLLDILKKHDVKATFFVLTDKVTSATRPIIDRMLKEGHLVASHGPDHARSTNQEELVWKGELRRSLESLARWHNDANLSFSHIYYRFPYGDYGKRSDYHHMNSLLSLSKELMGDNCIQFAFWDVDTVDWLAGMSASEIAQNIIAHNEGGRAIDFKRVTVNGRVTYRKKAYQISHPPAGGVVLQHDIHRNSVLATEIFLDYAKQNGVKIVRLDEVEEFRILRDCRLESLY